MTKKSGQSIFKPALAKDIFSEEDFCQIDAAEKTKMLS